MCLLARRCVVRADPAAVEPHSGRCELRSRCACARASVTSIFLLCSLELLGLRLIGRLRVRACVLVVARKTEKHATNVSLRNVSSCGVFDFSCREYRACDDVARADTVRSAPVARRRARSQSGHLPQLPPCSTRYCSCVCARGLQLPGRKRRWRADCSLVCQRHPVACGVGSMVFAQEGSVFSADALRMHE
jgi:hypothetical protein